MNHNIDIDDSELEEPRFIPGIISHTLRTAGALIVFWAIIFALFVSVSMSWKSLHPTGTGYFDIVNIGKYPDPGDVLIVADGADGLDTKLDMVFYPEGEKMTALATAGNSVVVCENGKTLCSQNTQGKKVDTSVPAHRSQKTVKVGDADIAVADADGEIRVIPLTDVYGVVEGNVDARYLTISGIISGKTFIREGA